MKKDTVRSFLAGIAGPAVLGFIGWFAVDYISMGKAIAQIEAEAKAMEKKADETHQQMRRDQESWYKEYKLDQRQQSDTLNKIFQAVGRLEQKMEEE